MKPYGLKNKKVKLCRCCIPDRSSKEINKRRVRQLRSNTKITTGTPSRIHRPKLSKCMPDPSGTSF